MTSFSAKRWSCVTMVSV